MAHSSRIRIGVVGAGLGAGPHFKALDDLADEVETAWVYGRDAQRLAAAVVPAHAQRTTRLEDLLDDPLVAAVLVLTPAHAHLEVAQRAAAAGKHVLVEKPLDIDLPRARALVACCESAGVLLGVMLQHRLREGAQHLVSLIRGGTLGPMLGACASVRWWRPQSYYDVPGRGTLARDGGGVLMTQAIHTLDLLLTFAGEPQRVTGVVSTSPVHRMECEDTATALLHYPGNAVAVVQATTAAYPGYPERIEMNFQHASATLESGGLQVRYMDGRSETAGAPAASGGGADPMGFDHGPHRAVLQDFVAAVRTGGTPAVTGRSALAVHELIATIVESSRCGTSVSFPATQEPPR